MGGIEFSAVEVSWGSNVPSDSVEVLQVIRSIDQFLASEDLIGHPISIRNFIDALPGEGDAADRMSMLELLPPPLKRAFYTPEKRKAKFRFVSAILG